MAESPAHKFGQIVGDVLEAAIEPLLRKFAAQHGLYLDKKGPRPARKGKKVKWTDQYGNTHDLDYVLERGGTPTTIGIPVAFIETAWRRYTKHSRNKAQEIQGAILPLVATHQHAAPFIGVILAGVFTENALVQLRSLGFTVLYFPYQTVVAAFEAMGIDAHFDEQTPDANLASKVRKWEKLSRNQRALVTRTLVEANSKELDAFLESLRRATTRQIALVRVLPLHGAALEWISVGEAVAFVQKYDETAQAGPLARYELEIRYNNGDRITAQFEDKQSALQFLLAYQTPNLQPAS